MDSGKSRDLKFFWCPWNLLVMSPNDSLWPWGNSTPWRTGGYLRMRALEGVYLGKMQTCVSWFGGKQEFSQDNKDELSPAFWWFSLKVCHSTSQTCGSEAQEWSTLIVPGVPQSLNIPGSGWPWPIFAQPEGLALTLDRGVVVGAGHVCGESFVAQVSTVTYWHTINIE